jgi:hypothetical protein
MCSEQLSRLISRRFPRAGRWTSNWFARSVSELSSARGKLERPNIKYFSSLELPVNAIADVSFGL